MGGFHSQGLDIAGSIGDAYIAAKQRQAAANEAAMRHQEASDTLDLHHKQLTEQAKEHMDEIKRQLELNKEAARGHYADLYKSGNIDTENPGYDNIKDASGNDIQVPRMNTDLQAKQALFNQNLANLPRQANTERGIKAEDLLTLGPIANSNQADLINATATPEARAAAIKQGALAPGLEDAANKGLNRQLQIVREQNKGKEDVQGLRNQGGLDKLSAVAAKPPKDFDEQLNGFARVGSLIKQLDNFAEKYNTEDNPTKQSFNALGYKVGQFTSPESKSAIEAEKEIKGIQLAIDRGEFGAKGTIPVKLVQQLAGNFPDLGTTKTNAKDKIDKIKQTINANILALTSHLTPEERDKTLKAKGIDYFKAPGKGTSASAFYGKTIHLKKPDGTPLFDGVLDKDSYSKYKSEIDEALGGLK